MDHILTILAQVPQPKDGESAWEWVAVASVTLSVLAIGWLGNKVVAFLTQRGDEWKQRADTCLVEQGKTGDALKLANDATERLAKLVVDGGVRLETKVDANSKTIDALARDVARLLDRPSDQGMPSRRS